jgi:hypothetical protein
MRYNVGVDCPSEITVFQLPKFKLRLRRSSDGWHRFDSGLSRGSSGCWRRDSRIGRRQKTAFWAAKGKGTRGGARIIYLYVVVAERIYLIRCYAKNQKTDLTPDETKRLKQIAAHLKGAH